MLPSVRNIRPPSCGRRFRYFVYCHNSGLGPRCTVAPEWQPTLLFRRQRDPAAAACRVVSRTAQLSTILAVNEAEHLNRRR